MLGFISRLFGNRSAPSTTIRRGERRTQLTLEQLEDRLAPATFTVTTLTDNGPANGQPNGVGNGLTGDLRFCMTQAKANGGSTIQFQPGLNGTIFLANVPLPSISANTTIMGLGPNNLAVQASATVNNPYCVFAIDPGATVDISGITIKDGFAALNGGGGIVNKGNLTLSEDKITNNFAIGAGQTGGGIFNATGASLTLQEDIISFNQAVSGGGLANYGTANICCDTQFLSNDASAVAGAIYNSTDAQIEIFDNSLISSNTASQDGGGVFNVGTFIMHGGSISGNDAGGGYYGGGVFNAAGGDLTLDQGLFVDTGNDAMKGAGLYLQTGSTTNLDTITIQNNVLQAGGQGKGIYQQLDPNNPGNNAKLTQNAVANPDGLVQGN